MNLRHKNHICFLNTNQCGTTLVRSCYTKIKYKIISPGEEENKGCQVVANVLVYPKCVFLDSRCDNNKCLKVI